jgi:prophage regulatory protein
MLSRSELRTEKGIPFSRQHLHRLIAAGRFPRPIKIGENTNAWLEAEVDEYLSGCIAARDTAAA